MAGDGGLSGAPLKARGLEVLERLYERAGHRLVLVSVGGIETPEDAWARILAGATLVQAYTAFVYGGPLWPCRMNRGLARLLRDSGMPSLQMAIGATSSRGPVGMDLTSQTYVNRDPRGALDRFVKLLAKVRDDGTRPGFEPGTPSLHERLGGPI